MAKFTSPYKNLSFYANGEKHNFSNGVFITEDAQIKKALAKAKHVKEEKKKPTKKDE